MLSFELLKLRLHFVFGMLCLLLARPQLCCFLFHVSDHLLKRLGDLVILFHACAKIHNTVICLWQRLQLRGRELMRRSQW